jgi:hypothetical protein
MFISIKAQLQRCGFAKVRVPHVMHLGSWNWFVGFKIKTAFVACNTNYTITQSANAMQA